MAGGIFVSYRRDDSRHAAGRLLDRLRQTYEPHQLFMDVDNVAPGLDFAKVLEEQVAACDAMLVLIGPDWLDARDDQGYHRLDNPGDFVRIEVEAALKREVRVIPVLVDGATMPHEDALPKSLRPLARRQGVRLTHERFGTEADNLVKSLRGVVQPSGKERWDTSQGPTARSTRSRLWLGALGLMVGLVLFVGSWLLVHNSVTWPRADPDAWARLTIVYMVPTAFIWVCLTGVSAIRAATSEFWWLASAASCAATLFGVAVIGVSLFRVYGLVPAGADPAFAIIALAAVPGVYALAVRLYLWKAR